MMKFTRNGIILLIVTLLGAIGLVGYEIWQYSTASKPYTADEIAQMEIDVPVNINTADIEELRAIPGMNEKLALSVLTYREEHGGFTDKSELIGVNGIGDEIYRELEPYITAE